MIVKKFNEINESVEYNTYTIEDSEKLLNNILNEWDNNKPTDVFQKARVLGGLETILLLNGKLEGGKPYDTEGDDFETLIIGLSRELQNDIVNKEPEPVKDKRIIDDY